MLIFLSLVSEELAKKKNPNLGLLSGAMGETIFLFEYAQFNSDCQKQVDEQVKYICEAVENGNIYHSYSDGLAGICLGVHYIESRRNSAYPNFYFVNKEVDAWMLKQFHLCIAAAHCDFLHGAIGMAMYYLERLKCGEGEFNNHLQVLVKFLSDSALIEGDTARWEIPQNTVNISLSHGMASIVLFLLEIYRLKLKCDCNVKRLIRGGINFILSQQIDFETFGSLFPSTSIKHEGERLQGSRLAWCYGDLGIAVVLKKAAALLGVLSWNRKSQEILEFALRRNSYRTTGVVDANICHGSSGIALVYYQMYLQSKSEEFRRATEFWITKTMELFEDSRYNLSKVYYDSAKAEYQYHSCLLTGTAGVGLAFMAVLERRVDWMKFLLL